jgi:uncharacterized protein (DUF427 family)
MKPTPIKPNPGQESVWDYPRPPRLEEFSGHIQVVFNGITIADTHEAIRVLETSHPPVYYIPPKDIQLKYVIEGSDTTWCEWKGQAKYYSVVVGEKKAEKQAWCYPQPTLAFAAIKDYIAFYAGMMDACYVNAEQVIPQPGGFYGGWLTKNIVGPFKGGPGSWGW